MDDNSMKDIHALLLSKRGELIDASKLGAGGRGTVALDQQSVGRVSRVDALQQQAMSQAQERQRQHDLVRIEQALKRLEDGDYGYCVDCGEPIPTKRLDIDPATALCVSCAGREQQ